MAAGSDQPSPIVGIIGPSKAREPYSKPQMRAVPLSDLHRSVEGREGSLYRDFNALADRLEAFLTCMEQFEKDLMALSQALDQATLELSKIQFVTEQRAEKPHA